MLASIKMDKCMKSEPSAIFSSNIGHHKYSAWVPRDLFHAYRGNNTAQKMKFSIKDFFSKCDQIRSFLKSLMKSFILLQCNCQRRIQNPVKHQKRRFFGKFSFYLILNTLLLEHFSELLMAIRKES